MPTENRVRLNNPAILAWAREEVGLSKSDVAHHVKKPVAVVEGWEKGDQFLTFRQLTELANYYKRPVAIFFLPAIPPKFAKPTDHRTLSGIAPGDYSRVTLLAYREVANMLWNARELLDQADTDISFGLPHWTITSDPEQKADELRSILGISVESQINTFERHSVALDAWRDALFDRGVIVRVCEMPITDARAFCLIAAGLGGIGLSNQDREHARIFSLFHEVCHLCLNQPGVSGTMSESRSPNQLLEQYCDRFSASFLLPSSHSEVLDSLALFEASSIDCLELAQQVAQKFKVSKYVALRRAFDLGYVAREDYWKNVLEWRSADAVYARQHKRKGGPDYNVNQISRLGKRFVTLVMRAVQSDYLSSLDARRILGVDPSAAETSM
jgi:Zn-dependent peptidase ImmA (M78 family)